MARSALAANPDAIASRNRLRMDRYFFRISPWFIYTGLIFRVMTEAIGAVTRSAPVS
jgi:hypothetical protein